MSDIDDFIKDPWKLFNEMRKTPHVCDYEYSIDPSGTMFFEICKLCLDTKGVIEMGEWDINQNLNMVLALVTIGIGETWKKNRVILVHRLKDNIGKTRGLPEKKE